MTRTSKPAKERSGLLLGISLLAGLYVTVAILVLLSAVLFVPVVLALGGHVNTAVLVAAEFVAVGSVPGLMMIYYCVFTLRRSDDKHPAVEVSPRDAPDLWDMVNEVATVARTRPPTRLRVAAVANATVFEETRLLGFAGGQRYLTIGLPLLLGLTAAELRAVLAHEMGHYARGHTRLGAQVYRGSAALRNTCQALQAAREPGSHRSTVRVMWRMRSLYAYIAYGVFAMYSAPARRPRDGLPHPAGKTGMNSAFHRTLGRGPPRRTPRASSPRQFPALSPPRQFPALSPPRPADAPGHRS